MGYSSTDYTRRPAAAVEADVARYRSWYSVSDIFLDEVSSDGGAAAYYQRLASYIHNVNPGSTVMLNPGAYPDQRYMSIGDIVMVHENTYANYVKLRVPGWVPQLSRGRNSRMPFTPPRARSWQARSACPGSGTPATST